MLGAPDIITHFSLCSVHTYLGTVKTSKHTAARDQMAQKRVSEASEDVVSDAFPADLKRNEEPLTETLQLYRVWSGHTTVCCLQVVIPIKRSTGTDIQAGTAGFAGGLRTGYLSCKTVP